ncbi:MAG TPA: DUF87 domain-containing protein [Candidatus Bathyarchaeia archaeon]|nr:DUF87 domain-containing protein [Candidatus Bathyarchaeia archaeon]
MLELGFPFSLENYEKEGLRIFLTAMPGGGKSYVAKVFCEELITAGYPLVIVDPEGEYASLREFYPTVIVGGSFADIPLSDAIIDQTITAVLTSQKPLIAIYDLNLLLPSERNIYAAMIQEKLFASASKFRRSLFFIVEECQLIAPQILSKGQDPKSVDLAIDIAKRGRKRGINSIWITQRPADISKAIITQCNMWLFGKLIHKTDLDQIKDFLTDANIEKTAVMKLENQFFIYDGKNSQLVKFRKMRIKDLAQTPLLGETIKLERSKDRSLESIIKDLVKQAEQEQQKQQERKDRIVNLEQQVQRLEQRLQEKEEDIKRLNQNLDLVGRLKVVSGSPDNEALQQVLDERHSLEKEKKSLEKQYQDLQQQYEILTNTIDQQNEFIKVKEKLRYQLQELLETIDSLGFKEKALELEPINLSSPVAAISADDALSFIRHPAIKKEIQEAIASGVSAKAVKGIIALLIEKSEASYEEIRRALGYADKTLVSKAGSRLADRKILLQEKSSSGEFILSLNLVGLKEVIDLQDARVKGERAIDEIFGKDT